jgi:hypothetical protein
MWVGENSDRPVVARRNRSVKRVMYAVFVFDSDDIYLVPLRLRGIVSLEPFTVALFSLL